MRHLRGDRIVLYPDYGGGYTKFICNVKIQRTVYPKRGSILLYDNLKDKIIFFKIPKLITLAHRHEKNIRQNHTEGHCTKYLTIILQSVMVKKDKEPSQILRGLRGPDS